MKPTDGWLADGRRGASQELVAERGVLAGASSIPPASPPAGRAPRMVGSRPRDTWGVTVTSRTDGACWWWVGGWVGGWVVGW